MSRQTQNLMKKNERETTRVFTAVAGSCFKLWNREDLARDIKKTATLPSATKLIEQLAAKVSTATTFELTEEEKRQLDEDSSAHEARKALRGAEKEKRRQIKTNADRKVSYTTVATDGEFDF
ncbi:unnamed protein product [Allacma fusca]|uniref:Uncharacterized protein n=1 Tax=Allacma fusca TaxID=39272 RepID=A0A8J2PNN1_9HEXA|nr:unnamed protein product [Allacma fusca]